MSKSKRNYLTHCSECGGKMEVVNTRHRRDYTYRRRTCSECAHSVSTQERIQNEGKGRPSEIKTLETRSNALTKRFIARFYQALPANEQLKFMDLFEE